MGQFWLLNGRPSLRDVRLICGLVFAAFVVCHLVNHALGLVSIETMERARPWLMGVWRTPPGQLALYGSLIVHAGLGVYALVRRRVVRMPAWEAVQLIFGLLVPFLLLSHIVKTNVTRAMTGVDIGYLEELTSLWVVDPAMRIQQTVLLVLVWTHLAMGLHYWLRLRDWYQKWQAAAIAVYCAVPIVALLGFAQAGKRLSDALTPADTARVLARSIPPDPALARLRGFLKDDLAWIYLALLVGTVTLIAIVRLSGRNRGFVIEYPGGARVRAGVGMSVLEASRAAGLPHMSVCGGRARCTTCRVRIDASSLPLPEPDHDEARALARIGAPVSVRLACQLRPHGALSVAPLLKPTIVPVLGRRQGLEFGDEREVTVLFVDLRGSSRLAETRLPFDTVFLLNAFLEEMAGAVSQAGGHYSNFTGDGLMALFGLGEPMALGAEQALRCARAMLDRLEQLNARLAHELDAPLRIGVGIHTGEAIIGHIGPPGASLLTALGDTVNSTARLESLTKEFAEPVLISSATLAAAGIASDQLTLKALAIRGREGMLSALSCDLAGIDALLSGRQPATRVA